VEARKLSLKWDPETAPPTEPTTAHVPNGKLLLRDRVGDGWGGRFRPRA